MRSVFVLLFFFGVTLSCAAQKISPNTAQDSAARAFIEAIFSGNDSSALNMFDPEIRRTISPDAMRPVAELARTLAASFTSDVEPHSIQLQTTRRGVMIVYAYRFKADVSPVALALLHVFFKDSSATRVAGFNALQSPAAHGRPADGTVRSSRGTELTIEGEQVWVMGEDSVQVNGLSLAYVEKNEALLFIKVEWNVPNNVTKEQATVWGIPIVRHAIRLGYLARAQETAAKNNRTLLPQIGVMLIQPGTSRGYRVQIPKESYAE